MRIHLLLLLFAINVCCCITTFAQTSTPVYLEVDKVFINVAALKDSTFGKSSVGISNLENFGRNVEVLFSDPSKYPSANPNQAKYNYEVLATLLVELQRNPQMVVRNYGLSLKASKERLSMTADLLFIEYLKIIYRPSLNFSTDPLKKYIQELQKDENIRRLNIDLDSRLGEGVDREFNAAKILIEMNDVFSDQGKLDQLRSVLLNGSVATVPYPLCLLRGPCPKRVGN
jgi:hypothetical protein